MTAKQSEAARVYIVLVNWKGAADTLECLETVFRLDYPNFEVVVCDNDSGDGSVERIMAWAAGEGAAVSAQNPALAHLLTPNIPKPVPAQVLSREQAETVAPAASSSGPQAPRLTVIRTGGNLGFAGGNNIGIRYAQRRGDMAYVWLLNNDTVVDPAALTHLIERSKVDADVVVGSTLIFYGAERTLQAAGCATYSPIKALATPIFVGRPVSELNDEVCRVVEETAAYVVGASMLVPLAFIEKVGLMEDDYFLYFEELDWAERGLKKGFRSAFAAKSLVFHKVGASTGARASNQLSIAEKLSYLNRIVITKRFYSNWIFLVRLRIAAEAFRALLAGKYKEASFAFKVAIDCANRPELSVKP